jgi:signal transduction histidine kinase
MEITEKETAVRRTTPGAVAELESPRNETPQCLPVPNTESAPATARKLRLVVVEDNPSDVELVRHALKKGGFDADCTVVQTAEDFKNVLHGNGYEIVLADYSLPAWNGLETVEVLRQEGLDVPVIVVSGALGDTRAVECIKQGAADYVLKDHLARLPDAVRRALREKKLRDDNRQAQEELARSNRDLEQFAYVASHDLQEPLRMVATYTQLLAERYQGKLDENADKYIHYAVDGALRMQTLVQDLLAFSRVGREGNIAILVDVNLAVQAALINLQSTIQDNDAQVQFGELPSIVAEQTQLTQLFQNLISNAIKFRGKEPPRITISAEKRDREWILSVADNGIGIAPEYAETIFVIFKRLHTQEEYAGSGIGLAICKKVVEQHGGRIWMESEPGKGSTFKVALPVRRA